VLNVEEILRLLFLIKLLFVKKIIAKCGTKYIYYTC